jgi:hypothetical protein
MRPGGVAPIRSSSASLNAAKICSRSSAISRALASERSV